MAATSYAIGLGSNRAHGRYGRPDRVIPAALEALAARGVAIVAVSRVAATAPLGPGGRRYANAAAVIETRMAPPALLGVLKAIEHDFGRRPGRRWGPRVIDLDILLWTGGRWRGGPRLTIPHAAIARRSFVLAPLAQIAPDWRVPPSGRSVRHLAHAVDRGARAT